MTGSPDARAAGRPVTEKWNQRFVAYARATGAARPEAALARDKERSGCMVPFMSWMRDRAAEYAKARGMRYGSGGFSEPLDQADYTAWLAVRAEELRTS